MLLLRSALRGGVNIDWLEFQDFGGLAHVTLSQRDVDGDWGIGKVAIRLHGPESVLRRYESRTASQEQIWVADLERASLQRSDTIVARGRDVAQHIGDLLGIEWRDRLIIQQPVIFVPRGRQ